MGSWFSNFHIRKRDGLSIVQVLEGIGSIMKEAGYERLASLEGADFGVAVLSGENSAWFSVQSDFFGFEDPQEFAKLGRPIGNCLHTDILGISCMDSDFLYLNLLNEEEETDGWVHIGSGADLGIRRRTGLAAWKKKVENYPTFRDRAQQKYLCAEEFLYEVADCLKLPPEYSNLSYSELQCLKFGTQPVYLYFKGSEQEQKELPKLQIHLYSLGPCEIGKATVLSCINTGGKSRGLSVYFIGDYVEREEIRIEEAQWQERKNGAWIFRPIKLEKFSFRTVPGHTRAMILIL